MKIRKMVGTTLLAGALAAFTVPVLAIGSGNTTGWVSAPPAVQQLLAHHGKSGKAKWKGKTKGSTKGTTKGKNKGNSQKTKHGT